MKVKLWLVVLVTLVLLTALLASACRPPTPTPPATTPTIPATPTTPTSPVITPTPVTPKYGGTFTAATVAFPGIPIGWPPEARGAVSVVAQHSLETLLQQDISGRFSGRLATEWKVAPDLKSVTFKLRQGVKFHDGTDFNAQAVKWNYDLQMPTGKASSMHWESIEVLDALSVRVNLKQWTNYTLGDFSFEGGNFIISPTAYEKNGLEWVRWNMVGTGPFKQVSFVRDSEIVYEKFDGYWNKGKPYIDKLVVKRVVDPMTQVAGIKSGELSGMSTGADKRLYDLLQEGFQATIVSLGVGAYFPDSSNTNSPLANQKVREALDY
ncbi:MAG TPA: ABC transporter substrate-binding protein, partial [Dehalococcoidales bacterium]|nr:ABC transporter substrate-binding protein [Dehalococcoidales bacterium]